jgi:hypothetical protein
MRYSKDAELVKDDFIRPNDTTAYSAGDVVSDNSYMTFSNVTKIPGSKIVVINANLLVNISSLPSGIGAFRLHLYSEIPTAINDNAAFDVPDVDLAKYLGYLPIVVPVDLGSKIYSQNVSINKIIELAYGASNIYGILQTVNSYTPSALDRYYLEVGILGADGT